MTAPDNKNLEKKHSNWTSDWAGGRCLTNITRLVELGEEEEEEELVCQTDWQTDHRWFVSQNNKTSPIPSYLLTSQGPASVLRISKR